MNPTSTIKNHQKIIKTQFYNIARVI